MSAWIAIGLGCRAGCAGQAVVNLIDDLRDEIGRDLPARLFTLADKADEPGLVAAAAALGVELTALPRSALAAVAERVVTASPASAARFGLPSVSEAAALAGAGPGAVLLRPRLVRDGVTGAAARVLP